MLSVPLEKHALKRARYIIYHFPLHTCNTLSNKVSIHQRVYFHTCIKLSSKISKHPCIKYCFPLRFPLHLCKTIFRTGKTDVHEFLPFSSIAKHALQRGNFNLWRHCHHCIRIVEERFRLGN